MPELDPLEQNKFWHQEAWFLGRNSCLARGQAARGELASGKSSFCPRRRGPVDVWFPCLRRLVGWSESCFAQGPSGVKSRLVRARVRESRSRNRRLLLGAEPDEDFVMLVVPRGNLWSPMLVGHWDLEAVSSLAQDQFNVVASGRTFGAVSSPAQDRANVFKSGHHWE